MANKKTSELKDLEPLDRQTNDEKHERRDMREIPKTSIKKEQSHLMYLLEQHTSYFLDAELTELRDNYQVHYHITEHNIPFEKIKSFSKAEIFIKYWKIRRT